MSNTLQSMSSYDPSRARFAAIQAQINADQYALDLQQEAEDQAELDAQVAYVVASDLSVDQMPAAIQAWLADFACNEGLTEIELIAFLKRNDALPH